MVRRLAAIMAADVVDYSRLMGEDEARTLGALRQLRKELFGPIVTARGGQVVKNMGDGWIVEFPNVSDGVACAVEIQEGLSGHEIIRLRIGVHIGDMTVQDDDVYGDGVNIAARLEALAEPGEVLISDTAHHSLDGKATDQFGGGETHQLKNIARPVGVWRWPAGAASEPGGDEEALALPDGPSIAVLPFDNMSGDPEQEHFVDGVVEDILTILSKVPRLFVIARNSSFAYKGKAVDVRAVGRELGVRYVVEGSVRRAGNRVRVTAQLVECASGGHIWADKFDGDLDDVFELQDRITQEIVTALEVSLTLGEQNRIWRERSGSPLVYEKSMKGRELYTQFGKNTHYQARNEFEEALQINPTYAPAMVPLGYVWVDLGRFGWESDREAAYEKALEIADRAFAVDPEYGPIYTIVSYARSYQRRHDEAVEAAEKAVERSPNEAAVFHMAAMTHIYAGNFRIARDYEEQAIRLSPLVWDVYYVDQARAQFHLGEYEEARKLALRVLKTMPRWLTAQTILLAALWRLGREAEAREIAAKIIHGHPRFSVARWSKGSPYRSAEDLAALMDPLLEAGLQE